MTLRFAALSLIGTLLLAGCDHPSDGQLEAHLDTIAVGAIQGRGDRSPLEGQEVHIEGIITRRSAEPVQGWFVQDDGDGDPATPDTVFVQTTTLTLEVLADEVTTRIGNTVRVGDRIEVHGKVVELPASLTGGMIDAIESLNESPASKETLTAVEAFTVEVVSATAAP